MGFDPGPVNMRFVMDKVSLIQVLLPLSISFHQCAILIFIFILLLSEGQAGEAYEPSNIAVIFRMSGNDGQRSSFTQNTGIDLVTVVSLAGPGQYPDFRSRKAIQKG